MTKQQDRGRLIHAAQDEHGSIEIFDRDGVRSLYFDRGACQSSLRLDDPTELVLGYTQSLLAGLLFEPAPRRILLIGLGGGSLARFLLLHFPGVEIRCVETRPMIVDLAHAYFGLPASPRLHIRIGDGAAYLRTAPHGSFDMLLVDAFDSTGVHPSVCTANFFADCRRALRDNGVLAINLWNTPAMPCEPQLDIIRMGFAGQVLRLPVEKRANVIALGLKRAQTRQTLKQLGDSVQPLSARLEINLAKYVRRLQNNNGQALRRNENSQIVPTQSESASLKS